MVAVGEAVRQALIHNEGIAPRRIEIIRNGIPVEKFSTHSPASERAATRASIGLGPDDLVLIQVARLDYLKDHATAIRTIERVVSRCSRARLVLVGDGPERGAIESLVRQRSLGEHVRFLGQRDDVPRLLAASDIVLLTSISEGIPLTLIEGMAAGRPVVSTPVGGVAEVVVDGETGLLASADAALANQVLCLADDAARRDQNGPVGPATGRVTFLRAANARSLSDLLRGDAPWLKLRKTAGRPFWSLPMIGAAIRRAVSTWLVIFWTATRSGG